MKKRNILLRYIAGIVLTAFSFTFALPINQVMAAEQAQQNQLQIQQAQQENKTKQIQSTIGTENSGKSQAKTRLGSFTAELTAWAEKFQTDVDNGDLNQLKTDIKDAKQALKDIRAGIAAELDENEKTLQRLNAQNARERHNKFKAELDSNLNNFAALFDALDEIAAVLKDLKGGDISQLETLKAKIAEINNLVNPEQADQPLGALPHNNVSVTPPAPATGSGITAAYMGSTPDTTASALPGTPTPEDLAETDEVKFTQVGKDLADSLNTPVDIYEYVRNNVNFEPYYGSRKGSAGTLEQMAGNDYDQASLLISLLRYKNIPARYVRGTVDIPIEKVRGWTGAETAEAAVKALGSLGIPLISLVSGGTISAVRLEHVWVEAYVPYENYRGTGAMSGQKIWVPLDPSFKQYEKISGINLEEITGINSDQIVAALENNGEYSADGLAVTRVNPAAANNILSTATEKLQQYLTDNGLENSKLEDVFGGYKIIEQKLGVLPLSLPYKTNSVLAEMNIIPNEQSDQVVFSIKGADPFNLNFGGENDFDYCLKTSKLYGKRITLSWAPATAEDQAIINRYGSIFGVPAYLVQMKPQLKIDGVVAAEGKAIGLGYRQEFTLNLKSTGIPESKLVNPVTAGSYYCVGLDYQSISEAEIENIANRLNQYKDTANAQNVYTDEILGELLNGVAKTYFAQLDVYNKLMAQKYGIKSTRLLSEAITGYGSRVKYMFYCPVEVSEGSFFIDVDHDVFGVNSLSGDKKEERAYMLVSGAMGSYMEHAVWEQLSGSPSVSTMKVLSEANARGVPVYTINRENSSKILRQLQVSSSVKRDIQNAVAAGKIVIIPQKEIRYYDWQGSGYIILDTATGAAGYMISGGLAGGSDCLIKNLVIIAGLIVAGIILFEAISIFLAATSGAVLVVSLAGIVLAEWILLDLAFHALDYDLTGDKEAGNEAFCLAILNLIALPFGALLGKALTPLMEELAGTVFGKSILTFLDDLGNAIAKRMLATGYSEEFIQNIIRISGKQALTATEKVAGELEGMNVSRTFIEATGNSLGYEGLAAAKSLLQAGKATESELLSLVNAGYNLDDILVLANHNILPSELAQYGITNSLEAGYAGTLVKAGYSSEVIEQFATYGIKPSSYLSRGITTPELAEAAVAAETIAEELTTAAEGLENTVWRGTTVVNGETIVNDVSAFGEHIAQDMLAENGWSDFIYIKNGSDNGIDIIAKASDGHWGFFEVKTSSTGSIPDLSPRQANMNDFVEDVLSKAANGEVPYANIDSPTQDAARKVYNEFVSNPYNVSGNVIGVDIESGIIKVSRWDRW